MTRDKARRLVFVGLIACAIAAFAAASSALADWTTQDQKVIDDAGFTHGMAEHCGLDASRLLESAGLYIGIHTTSDPEAAAAGRGYKINKDEGRSRMASQSVPMPCDLVKMFVDGKVKRLFNANTTKTKITPNAP